VRSRSYSALITGVLVASITALTIGATAGAGVGTGAAQGDRHESNAASRTLGRCTMAVRPLRATIAVETWNVADFCELFSHAFSGDVFHAPVLVTLGVLWHYPDAELSCRLRYEHTRERLTIYNSPAACRWLRRGAQGWGVERGTAYPPTA
jgi:hypothetical protein